MDIDVTSLTTRKGPRVKLHDGNWYQCRQVSWYGMKLMRRVVESETDPPIEDVVEYLADLLGAPVPEVERLTVEQMGHILGKAAKAAEEMNDAMHEQAEKNGKGGRAKTARPQRPKK